jgi:TonB family protein
MCRLPFFPVVLFCHLAVLPSTGAQTPDSISTPPPSQPGGDVFEVVEQMPELIGGIPGLQARLEYPEEALRNGIEGRVFVQFVVDEQGAATDVSIARGIGGGCDEAAAEAVRASRFNPGMQEGRPVAVRMSLPVSFRLRPPALPPPPPPPPPPGGVVYEVVEEMPELLGGIEGLTARLVYPDEARREGIEGRVFVQFVVDEQGVPTDITVVRRIGGGCDEAAAGAVALSRFEPGRQKGRPVRVRMLLPVQFRLR